MQATSWLQHFTTLQHLPFQRADPVMLTCQKKRTQLISEVTARDMLPLCFVEGKGFCMYKRYIEPEKTVPTESHNANIRHSYFAAI